MNIGEPVWRVDILKRLDLLVAGQCSQRDILVLKQQVEEALVTSFDVLAQALAANNLQEARALMTQHYPGSLTRAASILAALRGEGNM